MKPVLLLGFEPFDKDPINPSWEVVRALDGMRTAAGATCVSRLLPCRFGTAGEALIAAIESVQPSLVIAVGLATGRAEISLERVAINVDDARIPDNAGMQPVDAPVVPGGPVAYFSTLPLKACVHALRERGIPASVSQTAGTFVCNHVFYRLQHYLARHPCAMRGGFVHVPLLPAQIERHMGKPSMALQTLVDGLTCIVDTAESTRHDLRETGGAEH